VQPDRLEEALRAALAVLRVIETDHRYVSLSPKGEPQLGKRGLYPSTGGTEPGDEELAVLWVLSQSDGSHSLLDVAERADLPYDVVRRAADRLLDAGLLAEASTR
jgi:aminopeptidase-like protein